MEVVFKVYIIGFIFCYIIWSLYFAKENGELDTLLKISCLSWLSVIVTVLLNLKNIICDKIRKKYRHKYWFCRIDNFNKINLKRNKHLALADYIDLKLKSKGIAPRSDKGWNIHQRFIRKYL